MTEYIKASLLKFLCKATKKKQDFPQCWNHPISGVKTQCADTDTAELLDAQSTLYVQKVCGTFLYYTIAVYQTMLVAMNIIATAQDHATTTTMVGIIWLLNYAAIHPDVTLHYSSSDMILHVTIYASYLCEELACIQYGCHVSLAGQFIKNGEELPTLPTKNIDIHTLCQITNTVMSSAVESEIGNTSLNSKYTLPICTTLKELKHT